MLKKGLSVGFHRFKYHIVRAENKVKTRLRDRGPRVVAYVAPLKHDFLN